MNGYGPMALRRVGPFTPFERNTAAKSVRNMASTLQAAHCGMPTLRLPVSIIWISGRAREPISESSFPDRQMS
jgi:hypothetical protein